MFGSQVLSFIGRDQRETVLLRRPLALALQPHLALASGSLDVRDPDAITIHFASEAYGFSRMLLKPSMILIPYVVDLSVMHKDVFGPVLYARERAVAIRYLSRPVLGGLYMPNSAHAVRFSLKVHSAPDPLQRTLTGRKCTDCFRGIQCSAWSICGFVCGSSTSLLRSQLPFTFKPARSAPAVRVCSGPAWPVCR